jgi:hypothetical protein
MALASALFVGGCDDATGPEGGGQLQVLLTDAPSDYIASALVWISRVYLKGGAGEGEGGEGSGASYELFNDPENPLEFDLLLLQDGITTQLTDPLELEAGAYNQLRLVVDEALVTLEEGYMFEDEETSKSLFVPSGMQSGIKVHLNGPIEITEGTLTIITVDFDVETNFVIQGNADAPGGIKGILFTPTLKEKGRTEEDMGG